MIDSKKAEQQIKESNLKSVVSYDNGMIPQKIQITIFLTVSNTSLMTLYCRAIDYLAKKPILKNKFSYDLFNQIDFDWKLVKKHLRKHDRVLIAIRVRKFDKVCNEFLKQNPRGIIVSLGSGLDNRFGRINNGKLTFVEVEFPGLIEFKKKFLSPSSNCVFIGKSVLDLSWIPQVRDLSVSLDEPVFFIAEGLFPYFEKTELKKLFITIKKNFPKSGLFFDLCGEQTVKYMSKHSEMRDWDVRLKSGFKSGFEIENWGIGFKLLEEWLYPYDPDAKRGLMKLMWLIPMFKYTLFFIRGVFE